MARTSRRRRIGLSPGGCGAGLAVLFALWARGGAASEVASARLDVQAPAACSSRADVSARVTARSPRVRFVDDGAAMDVRVVFKAARASVNAAIDITANRRISKRRLGARSCSEAADAVSLILAVTLDPDYSPVASPALRGEAASLAASTEAATAAEVPATPTTTTPTTTTPTTTTTTAAPAKPPEGMELSPAKTVEARTPAPVRTQARRELALALQMVGGPAPEWMPGLAVYAVLGFDREALWSPAFIVGLLHVWRDGLAEPGGKASFRLDAASVDLCPLRLHLARFEARPCATGLVGRLSAEGSATLFPADSTRVFAAAGGALVLAAAVTRSVELSARVGASATLVRDSFAFAPNVFHRADAITTTTSLAAGWRF